MCVTLRNAIILRTAHGMAGPFVSQFSHAPPRVFAEVESRTTMARRVGKGYTTQKSAELQDQRCVHLLANNCCSFSLEKQKSPQREFSPLEKDAPPYLDRRTHRILMHV